MKNTLRQITVVVVLLATIIINILADALPINGLNTGRISDTFHVYFVPAGYVFAIWGLIYIGLLAYAVYQALPSQKENPRLQATGWWVVLGGLANSMWIFLWHYELFVGTLAAMLVLLASLIAVYLRLGIGEMKVAKSESWAVRIPFSICHGCQRDRRPGFPEMECFRDCCPSMVPDYPWGCPGDFNPHEHAPP
jgi:benzodiazapine receptor